MALEIFHKLLLNRLKILFFIAFRVKLRQKKTTSSELICGLLLK